MARDVEFIAPQASVQEAAILMGEIETGALPVGRADQLEGIVTDRDILYRVVARGRDPSALAVEEIISRPVLSCRADQSLRTAMDQMSANYVRRLPVLDPDGRVVGWITLADIARRLLVGDEALQTALQTLTEGAGGD